MDLDLNPFITLIILNWNKAEETIRCLETVAIIDYSNMEVLVVDNSSSDGSVVKIREKFSTVTIIENKCNLGYAEGNNIGLRYSIEKNAKYALILNNDTFVDRDFAKKLVNAGERYPNAALIGPLIYNYGQPGIIQSAGANLDYLWRSHHRGLGKQDVGQFNQEEEVEIVSGSAVLVNLNIIKKIGLLDKSFFLYREDVDWCLRAKKAGYEVLFVPGATMEHRSHQVRESELPRITYYMTRNSLALMKKHRGGFQRLCKLLFDYLFTGLAWSIKPQYAKKHRERNALIRGVFDFFLNRGGQGPY